MTAIGWQVRGLDAVDENAERIVRRIVKGVTAGGIVAMHDGRGLGGTRSREPTLEALPRVIDGIRASGLEFARVDVLLGVHGYRSAK
jgi:peptidoglycan/xylan/chitin deacetylase (PgdA/CDA1 family)